MGLTFKLTMASRLLGWLTMAIIINQGATDTYIGQQSCICKNKWMKCYGRFPTVIPREATNVELLEIESDIYVDGAFCTTSWNNVRNLTIVCIVRCRQKFIMKNHIFRCLHSLESLKIVFDQLVGLTNGTFLGIEKVTSLDLTGCHRLCSQALMTAFSNKTVLPTLSRLILKSFGTIIPGEIEVNQTFVEILGIRPIQILDFSYTSMHFVHSNLNPLCDTLKLIDFSHSTFSARSKIDTTNVCESLRTIDLTSVHFSAELKPLSFNYTNKTFPLDRYGQFYVNVNNIYVNNLLPKNIRFFFHSCHLSITKNNITNLEISGYSFLNFDVEFQFTENHVKRIALADNSMESIGMDVFKNLTLLTEIDLSNNRPSRTKNFDRTFYHLFRRNSFIEKIYLANNGLTYIPFGTFRSNRLLSLLDISRNEFEQITIDVHSLLHMKLLDMSNNAIIVPNARSRNTLDTLFRKQQQTEKVNRTFEVDLLGNHFSCDYDSRDFVEWFVGSPLFRNKDHYTCQASDHSFPMNGMAIGAAKEDCERPIRRRRKIILASIVPFIAICCIIGVIAGILKRRRRLLRQKRYDNRVRLLQDDCVDFRFLVFLSFSSEDDRFVMNHVLSPLQHNLRTICKCDKDLVCIGDRYFRPGQTIFSEMIRCLDDSAVFIAVMSRNYCNSDYCKLEIEQARIQGKAIILIFIEEVADEQMTLVIREVFKKYTRVKFVVDNGLYKLQPDWGYVCESIIQLT